MKEAYSYGHDDMDMFAEDFINIENAFAFIAAEAISTGDMPTRQRTVAMMPRQVHVS